MSYILDALRKADAQRERGAARGIHAQATTLGSGEAAERPGGAWLWVLLAVLVVLGAAVAWYLMRDNPSVAAPVQAMTAPSPGPQSEPSATNASSQANLPPAAAPASVAQAVQPPPAMPAIVGAPPAGRTIPPRDPTNTSQPNPRGAQPVPGVIPEVPPSVRAAQARESAMVAQAQRSRPMPAAPQSAPLPQPSAATGTPPMPSPAPAPTGGAASAGTGGAVGAPALVGGLPPDAPKLAISGGVYSVNPTQRMLIVNGQVFNEGSELAPGVTLERIEPKTAILKFRGGSYTVGY